MVLGRTCGVCCYCKPPATAATQQTHMPTPGLSLAALLAMLCNSSLALTPPKPLCLIPKKKDPSNQCKSLHMPCPVDNVCNEEVVVSLLENPHPCVIMVRRVKPPAMMVLSSCGSSPLWLLGVPTLGRSKMYYSKWPPTAPRFGAVLC